MPQQLSLHPRLRGRKLPPCRVRRWIPCLPSRARRRHIPCDRRCCISSFRNLPADSLHRERSTYPAPSPPHYNDAGSPCRILRRSPVSALRGAWSQLRLPLPPPVRTAPQTRGPYRPWCRGRTGGRREFPQHRADMSSLRLRAPRQDAPVCPAAPRPCRSPPCRSSRQGSSPQSPSPLRYSACPPGTSPRPRQRVRLPLRCHRRARSLS